MEDTWTSRELPVLDYLVRLFEQRRPLAPVFDRIAAEVGLDEDDVAIALASLKEADPPFIDGVMVSGERHPVRVTAVTERARRAVGQWPTADSVAEAIVSELEQRASMETDPETAGRARRLLEAVGGFGRDLLVEVTASVISRQVPGG